MRETDDHFTAAQMVELKHRGLRLSGVPYIRVPMAFHRGISFSDDGTFPVAVQINPMCPIVDYDERSALVVLPDGEQRWVARP